MISRKLLAFTSGYNGRVSSRVCRVRKRSRTRSNSPRVYSNADGRAGIATRRYHRDAQLVTIYLSYDLFAVGARSPNDLTWSALRRALARSRCLASLAEPRRRAEVVTTSGEVRDPKDGTAREEGAGARVGVAVSLRNFGRRIQTTFHTMILPPSPCAQNRVRYSACGTVQPVHSRYSLAASLAATAPPLGRL